MARINAVLDEEVSYGFEGGGEYKTNITDQQNGFEHRDGAWKYARHQYSASFEDIDDAVRDILINFLHVCRGRLHSVKFKDHNDYRAIAMPLAVSAGTSETVQLYKTYSEGDAWTIRPIQAVKFAVIRDALGDPVAGTLHTETGEFTPAAPWGVGPYTWEGEFYVWVRFDADYNPVTINAWRNHTANVDLVEDKFKFLATNVPESWDGE